MKPVGLTRAELAREPVEVPLASEADRPWHGSAGAELAALRGDNQRLRALLRLALGAVTASLRSQRELQAAQQALVDELGRRG